MSATIDMSIVIAAIENVPIAHKVSILEALFKATKPSMKEAASSEKAQEGKVSKAKKEKDPNAPKKEANWWIQGTQNVITRLQVLLPENTDELKKPIVRTNIPKLLKERGQLTKESLPTDDQVTQAYKDWKEDPEIQARFAEARAAKKDAKVNKKDSDSDTVSSAQHKEEKEKKPRKPRAKKADTTTSDSSSPSASVPAFTASTKVEEGYGMIDGVKYRLADGTLDTGCFVYLGDECKGFYFDGAIDSSITP